MKKKILGLMAMSVVMSTSAFATNFDVRGWTGCTTFVDPHQGLTVWSSCQQKGTYQANDCDDAYNKMRADQPCCTDPGSYVTSFTKNSCVVVP